MTRKRIRNYSASFIFVAIAMAILALANATSAPLPSEGRQSSQNQLLPRSTDAGKVQRNSQTANLVQNNLPLPFFLPPVTYSSGGLNIMAVAVADVNLDGKPDLVALNVDGVGVLLGNGDGTFQPVLTYRAGGGWPIGLAVADINGDGKPDILVFGYNPLSDGGLWVLLGNGNGTFQTASAYDPTLHGSFAISDVNDDGKPDLVFTGEVYACSECVSQQVVAVQLGNGDGTFQSPLYYYMPYAVSACCAHVADLNSDGKPDIVVSTTDGIGVLLGNGDGTFQPMVISSSVTGQIAVADLNHDGKPDIVAAAWSTSVGVLLGNGDGTFQPAATYDLGAPGYSVAISDINGDSKPDLVVGTGNEFTEVAVLLGNGDGTFNTPLRQVDCGPGLLCGQDAVADLNGDGRPDVAVATGGYLNSEGFVGVMLHVGDITTTTSITSSLNSSVFGQNVTLSSVVQASSGTPTGTVAFYNGLSQIGSAVLQNGNASLSVAGLPVGTDAVSALYQGSLKFNSSASEPVIHVVSVATTTTSVKGVPNPAGPGKRVEYIAKVTSQYGGDATGAVTFWDGGSQLGAGTLKNNQAAYSISYSELADHSITAMYSGDSNNRGGTSPTLVEQIADTTSTSLTTSGSPSMAGQFVTFSVTVSSRYGTIPDGELVTFYDGKTAMASVPLTSGRAAYTTPSLSGSPYGKTHSIWARYGGDSIFAPSVQSIRQTVELYGTDTTATASPNPSNYGEPVTWIATVTSTGPSTPGGKVRFVGAFGSALVSGATATYVQRWLQAGTHAVTAEYEGDDVSAPSSAPVLNQVVNPASTTTVITSSANPSTPGQMVTFSAKVTCSTGAYPTGTLTFTAGQTILGTVPLNGVVAVSTAMLPVGSTVIQAKYNGTTDFQVSSTTLTQTVSP